MFMTHWISVIGLDAIHCTIHLLQLVVHDGMLVQRSIINLLGKCRNLASFLSRSSRGTALFRKKQVELLHIKYSQTKMLVKDVPTRWNSTYLMVKRILDLENTIVVFLNADRECDVQFSANDWDLMKALVRLLEPFFKATELLSANKIPISSVPLIIIEIKLLLGGNARFVDSMRDTLLKKLHDQFFNQHPNPRGSPVTFNILDDPHYTVPTLLNPSFRKKHLSWWKACHSKAAPHQRNDGHQHRRRWWRDRRTSCFVKTERWLHDKLIVNAKK